MQTCLFNPKGKRAAMRMQQLTSSTRSQASNTNRTSNTQCPAESRRSAPTMDATMSPTASCITNLCAKSAAISHTIATIITKFCCSRPRPKTFYRTLTSARATCSHQGSRLPSAKNSISRTSCDSQSSPSLTRCTSSSSSYRSRS